MADNININQGTGTTIATDDVGGVQYQRVKIVDGTADSSNPLKVNSSGEALIKVSQIDASLQVKVNQTDPNLWTANVLYQAAQSSVVLKTTPGAGLRLYLTDIIVSNGATAGTIALVESPGNGTVMLQDLHLAVNGGAAINLRNPIPLSPNRELWFRSTTVTNHSITINGYIA